jgi:hypothetical protein
MKRPPREISPKARAPLPESLVDTLSTILADAVIDDLRKHPELTSAAASQAGRGQAIMPPVPRADHRLPRRTLPSPRS